MKKYSKEYDESKIYMRQIKAVLRVPRLYKEYIRIQDQILSDKKKETYLKSEFIKQNDELNEEAIDSINSCLKL